jgi:hypothetical protein
MTSNRPCSGSPSAGRRRVLCGLSFVLAIAVALPEELPAAPMVEMTGMLTIVQPDSPANLMLLAHCCHPHPLPPYDNYCCHSGGVVVAPGYGGYYGVTGVRGQSRRVARRTTRRVSRRR